MIDLKLDVDDDLAFDEFDLVLIQETELVRQQIQMRLRFFQGEWYLNQLFGMPYFQTILIKNPDQALVAALFKRAVLTTPEVTTLTSFELAIDNANRKLSGTFSVDTSFGNISGEV